MAVRPPHSYALPEGLRYYFVRGSIMVPLVPMDQLPFRLQGIPRQLTHRQISDEGWKFLAETDEISSTISIQAPVTMFPAHSVSVKPRFLAPDHHARMESQTTQAESSCSNHGSLLTPTADTATGAVPRSTAAPVLDLSSSLTDAFASIYQKDAHRLGYRSPYPSGIEPDPSKKEYCTHWIKTGECAFLSIGCKYKHEMPSVDKLRELGFIHGMPKWWKEKIAIPARGQTWMQRRLAQGNEDAGLNDAPALRAFPDPSTLRTRNAESIPPKDDTQRGFSPLTKEAAVEKRTADRPVPLTATMQRASANVIHTTDLLIDLDDTPASAPSLQLSNNSPTSNESSSSTTPRPSSHASASPPPSPMVARPSMQSTEVAEQKEEISPRSCIHHHSQISWTSESEDDHTPERVLSKRKTIRTSARRSTALAKQSGLARSKYATISNQTQGRSTALHDHSFNRRIVQRKNTGGVVAEPRPNIEAFRRYTLPKAKAEKLVNKLEGTACAGDISGISVKTVAV